MSVIKQISVFNGSDWNTGDIGADASNIDISSAILGSGTNVQSALTTIGNKIGTTAIPSGLGTTITGAINTLNTNLNIRYISSGNVDINTYQTTGKYYFGGEASLTNVPNGAVNGWLIVLQQSGSIKQLWFRYGSLPSTHKDFYFRTRVNYTWSDWIKMVDETYLHSSDITSVFTTTSALSSFSAYANPYYIQVRGVIKTGTTDQTFLVNNIPTEYRPAVGSITLSTFWLNGTDVGKSICVYYASGSIQVRCSSAIAGSSGVIFSGMWIRK